MSTFENIKKIWDENQHTDFQIPTYDHETFKKIVMSKTKKSINKSMQYFWGAFVLQVLVYALLTNVIITHWTAPQTVSLGALGVALFIPFTVVLMKKFKQMAIAKPVGVEEKISLYNYVLTQHSSLQSFYRFKRRYELILIPLSTAIGVFLTFKLWVPGGVLSNPTGALITFAITVISCGAAIYSENKKNFRAPLEDLRQLLKEFNDNEHK